MTGKMSELTLDERLLLHARFTESGCWEWTRACTEDGYGRMSWQNRVTRVHRLSAHFYLGLDLTDPHQVVMHTVCDNPPCFNPAHLTIGTQRDNIADMVNKKRHRRALRTVEEDRTWI